MELPAQDMVSIVFEGKTVRVPAGISVAAAVLGNAHSGHTMTHPVDASLRAPYCLMGVCFECLMEINGMPNTQACLTPVLEGMVIKRQFPVEEMAE